MRDPQSTRILYIDDDPGFARLVQKDLERHGYDVRVVADGADGVSKVAAGGVDLVALDHYMPGQDGLATLAAIQKLPNPPPVVYVTGTQEGKVAVAALKAGAADYVIKDVDGEFFALLRSAIETTSAQVAMRRSKEAAEAEVRAARDRFEALAAERAILLREVNHRVGNSLQIIASLLHMQSTSVGDQAIKAALDTARGRVLAVAQVHERLYTSDDVRSVALDHYLQALIEDLRVSSGDGSAEGVLSLRADPIEIDPDRAVAIGVIVTELIINAQKYAYPNGRGPIRVKLVRVSGSEVQLTVEDDGVGRTKPGASATGMGTLIIEAMASKVGGGLRYDNEHRGTRALLAFDHAAASGRRQSAGVA